MDGTDSGSKRTIQRYYMKMKYQERQFLRARDFQDEQDYHIQKLKDHNRTLHTRGVCEGLEVTRSPIEFCVDVSPGTAIDAAGNPILLTDTELVDLSRHCPGVAKIILTIRYGEANALDQEYNLNEGGFDGCTRTLEKPVFEAWPFTSPTTDANCLLLAVITREASTGKILTCDSHPTNPPLRLIAGVKMTDVGSTNLTNGSVTTAKLADGAVTTAKIAAGAVIADKIVNSAITADKIANNSVTESKLATGAVNTAKLAAGAVTADKIANSTITSYKMANASVNEGAIQTGSVTATKIGSGAVTEGKIATGAVTNTKIGANAVNADKLATNAVTGVKIATGAVAEGKIASGAVTNTKIGAAAVNTPKIANSAVTLEKMNCSYRTWNGTIAKGKKEILVYANPIIGTTCPHFFDVYTYNTNDDFGCVKCEEFCLYKGNNKFEKRLRITNGSGSTLEYIVRLWTLN